MPDPADAEPADAEPGDTPVTVAQTILARADDHGVGLRWRDRTWTWAEVVRQGVARAALAEPLLEGGSPHIAVLLDNVPEYALWLGAAAMGGAVVVGADLARDLAHTDCRLLVTDSTHLSLVEGLDLGAGIGTVSADNTQVLLTDNPQYGERLAPFDRAAPPDVTAVAEESLGHLIFTSGTSGAPKACRCTQGRLARIGAIVAQMFGLTADDCCYIAMPLFHSNALMAGWMPAVAAGAAVALPDHGRFSASGFLPQVRRHGATYFNYVGKPLSYILATIAQPDDAQNPLRTVFGNEGAEADVRIFGERFGCTVVDSYGSTEGGAVVSRTPDTPPGALGRAPEGTLVLDPEGNECPPARFDEHGRLLNAEQCTGELVSKSGGAGFEGYWRNDEAEQTRVRSGWYFTGDLAYRDEAGFFYFAGRADDWLRVDGENFAAAPLSRLLERHPAVRLAAVYAVPDRIGDQVMAALELHSGVSFDPADFVAFLHAQEDLGTKWAPRIIRICVQLPMTATAKVLVRNLRSERWHCADPLWWTPEGPPGSTYVPLDASGAERLDAVAGGR
ncbi:MAG: AMP-binding protein [Acidimicrobiales bacterium]